MPQPKAKGGNILTKKYAGLPGWAILGGVGVLAYFYISKHGSLLGGSSSSTDSQPQGGTYPQGSSYNPYSPPPVGPPRRRKGKYVLCSPADARRFNKTWCRA